MKEYTLGASEFQQLVKRIVESGVPALRLVKHAGEAAADRAFAGKGGRIKGKCNMCRVTACASGKTCWRKREFERRPRVSVLSGCGLKGSCGWFAAEALADAGCKTTLIASCPPAEFVFHEMRDEAKRIARRAEADGDVSLRVVISPSDGELFEFLLHTDSVVDAMADALPGAWVGSLSDCFSSAVALHGSSAVQAAFAASEDTGRTAHSKMFKDWISAVNTAHDKGKIVVAIDSPSGVDAWSERTNGECVHADVTVCMLTYKTWVRSLPADIVGDVQCDWIGVWPLDYMGEVEKP